MNKTVLLAALCAMGATLAVPASADDDRGRRHDRHEHRHVERHHDRYDRRDDRRDYRSERRDSRYDSYRYERPRPRYVMSGRYCDDRRHLHSVHYHVAPRDYYAYGYPRDAYRLHRGAGLDATLILTLPLF